VVTEAPEPVRRRRHGQRLESALLAAGWDELVEVGYARLTMESVALRARTSEPVLYRRWANKDQLVLAAIQHHRNVNPVAVPDTGALRSDLLAQLTAVSEALAGYFAIAAAAAFSGLLADTGLTPAQAREKVMDAQSLPHVRTVYQRAHDRGEIDLERIPPDVLAMPFDLLRHDLLMDLKPLKPARILSIVDGLFLPLVQNYQAGQDSSRVGVVLHRGGAGDRAIIVQAGQVGGGPPGLPALRVGGPDRAAVSQRVAEHRVHRVVDGLVTRRKERH